MALYKIGSYAQPTTAKAVAIATGTAIKTLLQVVPQAAFTLKIVEWGISFDASSPATPGAVELIEADVGATITQHAQADFVKYDAQALIGPSNPTTGIFDISSTTKSGFNASGEGSITAVRHLDGSQLISPTNQFIKQFPLGREPVIQPAKFGRIRVHFGATVNAYAYVIVEV